MEVVLAQRASTGSVHTAPAASILRWEGRFERIHVDLGTGDGKYAIDLARRFPVTGVIGIDTNLDHLRGARRRHPDNVRFERIDVLNWSLASIPAADTVTINFPYGSLLRGLVEGDPELISRLGALLRSGSRLEIRVNETALTAIGHDPACVPGTIVNALGRLDELHIDSRELRQAELRNFPSSWSKRLGFGRATRAFLVAADRIG